MIKFPTRHQYYYSTNASSSISNLDLVSKIRHQQLIKESNEECEKIFSQGLFMFYHRTKKIGYMCPELGNICHKKTLKIGDFVYITARAYTESQITLVFNEEYYSCYQIDEKMFCL